MYKLRILGAVGESLRRLHLTANAGKSKILSLREAKEHFHFVANRELDAIEEMPDSTQKQRRNLRMALLDAWRRAKELEGKGEWQKVLKRFYRQAARAKARVLVRRAVADIKEFPTLVDRITDYIRYVSSTGQSLTFVVKLLKDPEQVYPDVNFQLIDSLLKLYPEGKTAKLLCKFATSILNRGENFVGGAEAKALAPLLILRYGDKRHLRVLISALNYKAEGLPPNVIRAICAVVGGCGARGFTVVSQCASRLLRNHLSEFVKLVGRIRQFDNVPGRFKNRVELGKDSITGAEFVDMRALLAARILGLCTHHTVKTWLAETKKKMLKSSLSDFDKRLLRRLWPTATHGK